jgi:hypothetical protein
MRDNYERERERERREKLDVAGCGLERENAGRKAE